jgi:hypothetical protein
MPSKPVDAALRDILYHIDLAANFSAGFDRASFKHDIKTVYAVTRLPGDHFRSFTPLAGRCEGAPSSYRLETDGRRGKRLSPRLRGRCG